MTIVQEFAKRLERRPRLSSACKAHYPRDEEGSAPGLPVSLRTVFLYFTGDYSSGGYCQTLSVTSMCRNNIKSGETGLTVPAAWAQQTGSQGRGAGTALKGAVCTGSGDAEGVFAHLLHSGKRLVG